MAEGKEEEEPTQTVLRECRNYKQERGHKSQFSEDLQILLFGTIWLVFGVKHQSQRPTNEYLSTLNHF